jgi:iron complex transport system ATP-binding protein
LKLDLLKTISLTIGYGDHILFNDLNLSLPEGKLVCFMGPNGIGKSTLLRCISGIQKPIAGSVEISSGRIEEADPMQIAIVLTDRIAASNIKVRELITFGRYPYLDWRVRLSVNDVAKIDNAIGYLQLQSLADKNIQELSDGQIQMVMIARALAQDTPIMLLDEPTAHLDLNNRVEIMKTLKTIARKMNKAILISTHELDLALQTADYIWLAGKDKNMLTGIPEDLVLDGSFDEVFRFKGYDLKTGKLHHEIDQQTIIALKGSGHHFLWTKNALERIGFEVIPEDLSGKLKGTVLIEIQTEESKPRWIITKNNRQYKCDTIAGLIEYI